jgi:hypothetical protein
LMNIGLWLSDAGEPEMAAIRALSPGGLQTQRCSVGGRKDRA